MQGVAYTDASGRKDIGSGDTSDPNNLSTTGGFIWYDIGNTLNSNSDSENMRASRYNPMLAPMWGKIIPCMCSSVNTTGGWGSTYTSWNEGACYNDGSSSDGRIYVQNAQWDGSTVTVVTWDGFDGHQEPVQPVCTNWSWGSCTDWACDYHYSSASDRAHFLQFQVIIRQDGRFTFFYKSTNGVTQPILSYNGWMVGVSGTWHSGQTCDNGSGTSPNPAYSPDNWCDVVLGEPSGTMGLSCDNDPGYAPNGDEVFTPGYWCSNNVQDLHSGLSGSWQTGE